jgi:hypothetical protein
MGEKPNPSPHRTDNAAHPKDGPVRPAHLQILFLALGVAGALGIALYWNEIESAFHWGAKTPVAETNAVDQRLAALERRLDSVPAPDENLAERIAALEEKLAGASDGAVAASLEARVKALEESLAALEHQTANGVSVAPGPNAAFAEAIAELAFPLFSSQPYEAELERTRALAAALPPASQAEVAPHFAALSRYAPSGIPSLATLHNAFDSAALAALKESALPEDASWWQRTLARIQALVVIRRTDGAAASAKESLLQEVDAALAAGRLPAAIALLEALPEPERRAFDAWLAEAHSRVDALAAYRALAGALR